MKKLLIFLLLLMASAYAATAQGDTTPMPDDMSDDLLARFNYVSDPVEIVENSAEVRDDVTVRDITFRSPVDDAPIKAYLVVPPGDAADATFTPILYVHWLEDGDPTSNRTEFLDEAVLMAHEYGVIALLPDTNWSAPGWYRHGRSLETDYDDSIRQVINLRRALDALLAQPGANADRLAVVGHDFGGMYGSMLAVVDKRPHAYVIIASASDFNNWMLFGVPATRPDVEPYKAQMESLAPIHFVAHAAPAPILFQFGTDDFYTPEEDYQAFFEAASEPKVLKTYDTQHAMRLPEIQSDRMAFLVDALGL